MTPGLGQLSSGLRHNRRRKRRERAAAASRVPGPEARRSCLLTELPGVLRRPGPRRLALRRAGVYLQPRHSPQPLGTPCPRAHLSTRPPRTERPSRNLSQGTVDDERRRKSRLNGRAGEQGEMGSEPPPITFQTFGGGVRRKGASRPGRGGAPPPHPAGNVRADAELTASPRLEKAPGSQWRQNPKRQAKGEKTARPNVDDPPLNPKVKSRKTHPAPPLPARKWKIRSFSAPSLPPRSKSWSQKKRGGGEEIAKGGRAEEMVGLRGCERERARASEPGAERERGGEGERGSEISKDCARSGWKDNRYST